MATKNSRYDALDGLRGVAAVAVMMSHFTQEAFKNAYVAVDLFFMLSGFVIAHSYGTRLLGGMTAIEYIKRRVIRLYPMLFISLLIGLPVLIGASVLGLSTYPMPSIVSATIHNLFFTPYIGHLGNANMATAGAVAAADFTIGEIFPANPPAWSLFFEMVASIAFVIIVRLSRSTMFKIIAISGVMFLITGALTSFESHGHSIVDFSQGWSGSRMDGGFYRVSFGFVVGVLLYNLKSSGVDLRIMEALKQVLRNSYGLYIVALAMFLFPMSLRGVYPAFVIFCVAPCLVMVGANLSCASTFEAKTAQFLGWLSYPVYLLHFPIGRAVFMLIGKPNEPATVPIVVACAVTLVSAIVLTRYVEEPIRAFLTKRLVRRPVSPVVTPNTMTADQKAG
ncbi:acyltransferase family protein [Paraburkholderia sp. XV]|uniref:acyltransferase family protein n=1 Tax=Paraburkholderia sp. XV TaxID=2831520 RepID=UPI001CD46C36|nr:acyltransferase [Paraburkholderia sp. XV]